MHRHRIVLCAVLLLAVSGCSNTGAPPDDGGTGSDGPYLPPAADGSQGNAVYYDGGDLTENLGEACTDSDDCVGFADLCIHPEALDEPGICTTACTPDNPATPQNLLNEDSCPSGFSCVELPTDPPSFYCLEPCNPNTEANPCKNEARSCDPRSISLTGSFAICWTLACTEDTDCPVYSAVVCADNATCTGALGADAFCTVGGVCALPGNCTPAGICGVHEQGSATAVVGDPCDSDLDCPNNGFCILEDVVDGRVSYRNGYCTIAACAFENTLPEFACPDDASCNIVFNSGAGLCFAGCDLDDSDACRGGASNDGESRGDYECQNWTRLTIGGVPVASATACYDAQIRCDSFPGIDCSDFGDVGNPTQMDCRNPTTGAILVNPLDPDGLCLDTTASMP